MKFFHISTTSLLLLATVASGAAALSVNDGHENASPRFSDPGGQNPSRIVSPPGGAPYYQPPSFQSSGNAAQVMSAYHLNSHEQ